MQRKVSNATSQVRLQFNLSISALLRRGGSTASHPVFVSEGYVDQLHSLIPSLVLYLEKDQAVARISHTATWLLNWVWRSLVPIDRTKKPGAATVLQKTEIVKEVLTVTPSMHEIPRIAPLLTPGRNLPRGTRRNSERKNIQGLK